MVVDKPSVNNKLRQFGREFFGVSASRHQENALFDIVDSIRQAKDDSNITGMVMDLSDFVSADQPSLQYIGKALREFRDAGKPIFAVGDNFNQTQYYLASFANKIYLTPQGNIDLHGFATNNLYYKTLLDKLKVTTHIFRVGTYKSAVEPFIRDDMSPAAREADSRWISTLWQHYLDTVAANRQITPQQLFPGAENLLAGLRTLDGDTARYALENKLVDEIASRSVIEQAFIKAFGWDAKNKTSISPASMITRRPHRLPTPTKSPWCLPTAPSSTARKPRGMSAAIPQRRKSATPVWTESQSHHSAGEQPRR